MNALTITGQIMGFIAMALIVLSFQFKDSRKLFAFQVGSCLFFVLHYLFLGLGGDASAYSGMAQNGIGLVFRVIILLGDRYKKLKSTVVLSIIAAVMAILAVYTASSDPIELLPVVGNFLCLGSMWTGDANVIRLTQLLVVSPSWLVYNIFMLSIAGILMESFNIVSIGVYYVRMLIRKRKEKSRDD